MNAELAARLATAVADANADNAVLRNQLDEERHKLARDLTEGLGRMEKVLSKTDAVDRRSTLILPERRRQSTDP